MDRDDRLETCTAEQAIALLDLGLQILHVWGDAIDDAARGLARIEKETKALNEAIERAKRIK